MENIIWVAIPGYVDYYEISNFGDIRSLDRRIKLQVGLKFVKGKNIRPKNNGINYLFVTLSKEGRRQNFYVHRLLALCFLPNPQNKAFVNHKDGNPLNNSLANLEWVSHSENVKHAYENCLNKSKGAKHHMSVGVYDKSLGQHFGTIKEWCKARGINYSTARNMIVKPINRLKMNIVLRKNSNDERA